MITSRKLYVVVLHRKLNARHGRNVGGAWGFETPLAESVRVNETAVRGLRSSLIRGEEDCHTNWLLVGCTKEGMREDRTIWPLGEDQTGKAR